MTNVLSGWIQLVSFLDEDFEIISWLRRESLFWIFGLISINASVSEQASKISLVKLRAWRDKLSPRIWAWCIQMLFALREIFEILFLHVKSEVIFSGFSLFEHTWNIKNTCTLFFYDCTLHACHVSCKRFPIWKRNTWFRFLVLHGFMRIRNNEQDFRPYESAKYTVLTLLVLLTSLATSLFFFFSGSLWVSIYP